MICFKYSAAVVLLITVLLGIWLERLFFVWIIYENLKSLGGLIRSTALTGMESGHGKLCF